MRNAGLEEAEAGIKIAGRNSNNLRYADDTTFKAHYTQYYMERIVRTMDRTQIERTSR